MANRIMEGLRVLDLTDKKGFLCGKILGELGMDVIKVEQPGGDPSRNIPPYYHNEEDPEKSLFWFAFNSSKRDVTLNLESAEGKELFRKLVAKADFVIESFAPGYMKSIGLGYDELAEVKPDIIMASITAFGQEGPATSLYAESDLVLQALATMLKRTGDPDRAPVKISEVPQSWLHGCMDAAEALMIANYYRSVTGEGQYIDCAIIESIIGDPVAIGDFNAGGKEGLRSGSVYSSGGKKTKTVWPCKDGFIYFQIRGGKTGIATNTGLIAWAKEEGLTSELVETVDWNNFDWFKTPQETIDGIEAVIGPFFLTHTKAELQSGATRRNLLLGRVADTEDLLNDEQFASRNYWKQIDYGDMGMITYPGAFAKFSATPLDNYFRAPHIGEHNEAVYKELCGLTDSQLADYQANGVL